MIISLGIPIFDGHPDYRLLVERADQALCQAKNSGHDGVALHSYPVS
ncbi:hypothetical protein [Roseomonas xinghualingensis]|nr:hypothetical protein [Roseomonas sp. SXEYE001]MCV4206218.1 hypothetical protein [Roseomonas sp. SXEYE001]